MSQIFSEAGRDIVIEEEAGVTHPYIDTVTMAQLAASESPRRALDLGTGTGYMALALAAHGCDVDAVDISPRAVELARRNAVLNGLSDRVHVIKSDWFSALRDRTYDLIVCNPPMQAGSETEASRFVTSTLRRVPKIAHTVHRLTQPFFERLRIKFICSLVVEARSFLREGGRLFLVISPWEMNMLLRRVASLKLIKTVVPEGAPPNLVVAEFGYTA